VAGAGFISRHKSLLIQDITNQIGKIHPKIHPSRIDWYLSLLRRGGPSYPQQDSARYLTVPLCPKV
jgi:hypothetical protein